MHRIRLGSAWRLHIPSCGTGLPTADSEDRIKFDLPARGELLHGVADDTSFELRRFFNRPSNLDDDQGVTLVFTGLANGSRIILNGSVLNAASHTDPSGDGVLSYELREKLLPRNELTIAFSGAESLRHPDAIILAAVALEIDSAGRDERS